MPNGGHPMHMVLRPRSSPSLIVYGRGPTLRVVDEAEWVRSGPAGKALLELDADEVAVIVDFLGGWLHRAPEIPRPSVDVRFDF